MATRLDRCPARRWQKILTTLVMLSPGVDGFAQAADPLPAETRLVAVSGAPAASEVTFTIASSEDLIVTLTDRQVPAALSTASVVVTQGGAIVGSKPPGSGTATLIPPATAATLTIPAAVGQYTLRVIGAPNASYSVGTFTVCVAPASTPSACITDASLAGTISASGTPSDPTLATLSIPVSVTTAGIYTVTYADDQFPVALRVAPTVALFQGANPVGPTPLPSGTQITLSPGTYTLLALAQADATVKEGLFGIAFTGPAGVAPLVNNTFPIGALAVGSSPTNSQAQSLTLKVSDFNFPAALAGATALATAGAAVLGTPAMLGAPSSFMAPAGSLQIWSNATAGADAGTFEVDLSSATGGTVLQTAGGVSNGSSQAFAFVTSTQAQGTLAAGSYQATASDFEFPVALQGLQFAVAQNGVVLQKATAAGTLPFTAVAGPVILLVGATAPASGNGLFDIDVQSATGGQSLLFDVTQAVGPADFFDAQTINLGTSGNFDVMLADLSFPASFQNLALVVSNGGSVLGRIYGGGKFTIPAMPGAYRLTFIAAPSAQQQYGLYALDVVNSPPTVTLTASPSTLNGIGLSTLSWTSTNASQCTASGGTFVGSEAAGSGNQAVSVATTTTYTLSCSGAGGTASASATVTVDPAPKGSGGGGGLEGDLIALLALLTVLRIRKAVPVR